MLAVLETALRLSDLENHPRVTDEFDRDCETADRRCINSGPARHQRWGLYKEPHLLGSEYTHLDFFGRKPLREDIGKRMLYRDAHMTGWSYKDITSENNSISKTSHK